MYREAQSGSQLGAMASVRFESLEEAQAKTTSEGAKWRLEKEHLAREYCIAVEEVKIMQEKLRECYWKERVNYKVRPPAAPPSPSVPPPSPKAPLLPPLPTRRTRGPRHRLPTGPPPPRPPLLPP